MSKTRGELEQPRIPLHSASPYLHSSINKTYQKRGEKDGEHTHRAVMRGEVICVQISILTENGLFTYLTYLI